MEAISEGKLKFILEILRCPYDKSRISEKLKCEKGHRFELKEGIIDMLGSYETHDSLEKLAPYYEKYWAPIGMIITARRRYSSIMKEAASFVDEKHVLDVGAGTGKLFDYLKCEAYIALDVSMRFLKILKEKREKAIAIRASVESLPFKDSTFKGVACLFVLHMVKEKELAVKELSRVLDQGGRMFLTTLAKDGLLSNILAKWWSVELLSSNQYAKLFEEFGLKVLQIKKRGSWTFFKLTK